MSCQTDWKYPKNANTQYYYREFSEEQKEEELKKENLSSFMTDVRPRFEEALQQNEIMNVFFDDWNALSSGLYMFALDIIFSLSVKLVLPIFTHICVYVIIPKLTDPNGMHYMRQPL